MRSSISTTTDARTVSLRWLHALEPSEGRDGDFGELGIRPMGESSLDGDGESALGPFSSCNMVDYERGMNGLQYVFSTFGDDHSLPQG